MSYRSYGAIERLSPPHLPLFLPLKSAALDFGLDMKRLDSFKLLSAQSGSALPDVFNKEPRTVASAAGGPGCCSRLCSILSNPQKKRELFTCWSRVFLFNLYPLIVWCLVCLSINTIYCVNMHTAFKGLP